MKPSIRIVNSSFDKFGQDTESNIASKLAVMSSTEIDPNSSFRDEVGGGKKVDCNIVELACECLAVLSGGAN